MANIYVMPTATVESLSAETVFPNVDQYSYRNVEGHGADKAFRYEGFESSQTDNPNVFHAYKSDTFLRFQSLFDSGKLVVGDQFVLGMVPELVELENLWVRQRNTIDGLELKITILDGNFAPVEAEGISIDFSNGCTGARWDEQPVQKFRYDTAGDLGFTGENEVFFLVAEIVALPKIGEWLSDCGSDALPWFQARLNYRDSCLNPTLGTSAPVDVHAAWVTASTAFLAANNVVLWNDIKVQKGGGFV